MRANLDRNDEVTTVLEEVVCVHGDDLCLEIKVSKETREGDMRQQRTENEP